MDANEILKATENTLAKSFGGYLRNLRKKQELTLEYLADIIGVTKGYLSNIENGRRGVPSPEILNKLAGPLGESPLNLMIKAGHINNESDYNPRLAVLAKAQLDHIQRWLVEDGIFFAWSNIDSYLKKNNITSFTEENLLQKLEEYINSGSCNNVEQAEEDLIYSEILKTLYSVSKNEEAGNHNLYATIKNAHTSIKNPSPLKYKDHRVTDHDRELIIIFLDALFTNRE